MSIKRLFKSTSVRGLLVNMAIPLGIIMVIAIFYFYIYLPSVTNHGESVTIPDLTGMQIEELDSFLAEHDLLLPFLTLPVCK